MHRATDVTKLRCVRSRNVFCCSCSHCGFIVRQLEYNLQTRFASVSHQSLGTSPRVSFNMRTHGWVFRRPLTPGGDESAIHTSETFKPLRSYLDDCILYILLCTGEGMTRAGFRGRRRRTWRCFRRCLHRNVTGIEACMGDQGCTGQGEVETGCFASDCQICARR